MVCGFRLQDTDPASVWMKHLLLEYLGRHDYVSAPEWAPEKLLLRLASVPETAALLGKKIDAGGRPV